MARQFKSMFSVYTGYPQSPPPPCPSKFLVNFKGESLQVVRYLYQYLIQLPLVPPRRDEGVGGDDSLSEM